MKKWACVICCYIPFMVIVVAAWADTVPSNRQGRDVKILSEMKINSDLIGINVRKLEKWKVMTLYDESAQRVDLFLIEIDGTYRPVHRSPHMFLSDSDTILEVNNGSNTQNRYRAILLRSYDISTPEEKDQDIVTFPGTVSELKIGNSAYIKSTYNENTKIAWSSDEKNELLPGNHLIIKGNTELSPKPTNVIITRTGQRECIIKVIGSIAENDIFGLHKKFPFYGPYDFKVQELTFIAKQSIHKQN